MKWFKIYGQKWFMGSTRFELTPDERSVWIDLLALSSINNPRGWINFFSLEQLAHQFNISLELLNRTLEKCEKFKKIKILQKNQKILILNWKKYQSEYERQLPYRQEDTKKVELQKMEVKSCNKVTLRRRRRIEEKENRTEEEKSSLYPRKFSDVDLRLVQLLIELMRENNPESSTIKKLTQKRRETWLNECRLLREVDGRTPEQIEAIIRFSQSDSFWKRNILSMPKLREKWDQLWLNKNAPKNEPKKDMSPEEFNRFQEKALKK